MDGVKRVSCYVEAPSKSNILTLHSEYRIRWLQRPFYEMGYKNSSKICLEIVEFKAKKQKLTDKKALPDDIMNSVTADKQANWMLHEFLKLIEETLFIEPIFNSTLAVAIHNYKPSFYSSSLAALPSFEEFKICKHHTLQCDIFSKLFYSQMPDEMHTLHLICISR